MTPCANKDFRAALKRFLRTEFPRLGGEKVIGLFVEELMSLIDRHHLLRDRVGVGQVLWYAVAADDPPFRYKRITDCRLVPVVLSLVSPEDIALRRRGEEKRRQRLKRLIPRLLEEAFAQGGVLSLSDLSLLLGYSPIYISQLTREYEEEHGVLLPRRGTIHDLGPTVSHKATIFSKAFLEGKQTPDIARETFHDEASVDRYLLDLDRVAYAMAVHGMGAEEICFTTGMSEGLVRQYMDLARELGLSGVDFPRAGGRLGSDARAEAGEG